jgi:hypothetical protein
MEPSVARSEVNQEMTEACPEKSKAGPEGMVTKVDTFEILDNMETNPEAMEAAVEQQELHNEMLNVDNIGSLMDQYRYRHLDVQHHQWAKKRTQGNSGFQKNWSPLENDISCHSCSAQGTYLYTYLYRLGQEYCCKMSL